MIIDSIVFLIVTIAVCTINLASITLSKPVERLLYEITEDVPKEAASSETEESVDTTAFDAAIEGGPIEEEKPEKAEIEEEDRNKQMDSVSKQKDAFSRAYSRKKPKKSKVATEEIPKPNVGMSLEEDDIFYDIDEEEEEEEEDLSAESIGYGKSVSYEDANAIIDNIKKAGKEE